MEKDRSEYLRAYRQANKERLKAYRRDYYQANKEKVDARDREYRREHPEKNREAVRRWRAKQPKQPKKVGPRVGRPNTPERLLEKLIITEDGCWVWPSGTNGTGYGQVRVNYARVQVHILVYTHLRAAVPDGFVLHHTCRNKRCANPDHLEAMTNSQHSLMHGQEQKVARTH